MRPGTDQISRSVRQLPPTSGSTKGMLECRRERRANQHAVGRNRVGEPSAARRPEPRERRQRRLEDGDAKAHQQRRGVERPDIDCHGPRSGRERRDCESDGCDEEHAEARDQQRARNRGQREHDERHADQHADLRLAHVQVVVDQRDDRRHREQRNPDGGAGKPEQHKRCENVRRGRALARRGRDGSSLRTLETRQGSCWRGPYAKSPRSDALQMHWSLAGRLTKTRVGVRMRLCQHSTRSNAEETRR